MLVMQKKNFDTFFNAEKKILTLLIIQIISLSDLRNTDLNSDVFIRKLQRAHEAISHSDGSGASSVKTLSASFGTKWPYKRTMSAPASIVARHELKGNHESKVRIDCNIGFIYTLKYSIYLHTIT